MENMILHAHRGFAYLVLVAAAVFVVALLVAMFGYSGKVSKLLRKSSLFTMILFHTQFLVGLGMLFFKSQFLFYFDTIGMGGIVNKPELRFSYVEHPVAMLVAAVLMTIVNKKIKTSETLNFGIVIMGLLAVVLFLLRFPFDKLFG
ncbi:hypothetical protein JSO56_08925 [Riemerella anatipestifer]|uniref:hypothetical protein n=1 Tax=Riemerella anatipestifer TaxID=34085 RepID=UPI0030BEF07A